MKQVFYLLFLFIVGTTYAIAQDHYPVIYNDKIIPININDTLNDQYKAFSKIYLEREVYYYYSIDGYIFVKAYYFYPNKKLSSKGVLIADSSDPETITSLNTVGLWKYYNSEGQLIKEEEYRNGIVYGMFREYYNNGRLKTIGQYSNHSKKVGKWKYYDKRGDGVKIVEY